MSLTLRYSAITTYKTFVQRCSFLTWLALKAAAKLFGTVTAISLDVSALGSVIRKAKVGSRWRENTVIVTSQMIYHRGGEPERAMDALLIEMSWHTSHG